MREIKFRAWDKNNKAMAIFTLGTFAGQKLLFGNPFVLESLCFDCYEKQGNFDTSQEKENYILMQYTELLDKNGKEIYCGDIVGDDEDGYIGFCNKCHGYQILYKFEGVKCHRCEGDYELSEVEDDLDITGNIYENKNLPSNFKDY